MNGSPKILFTATFSTSFIQSDVELLQNNFQTSVIMNSGFSALLQFIQNISSHEITFSWFASVYSSTLIWLTKLYNKKSILILGGVDVAKIPELNYGIWNSWWKSKIVRYGIKNADVVLAVDESIKRDAVELARYDGKNISVLPTGHDFKYWQPGKSKENFVLTVANCFDAARLKIKGIDFLSEVAGSLPDTHFVVVGIPKKFQNQIAIPENITVHEYQSSAKLLDLYQRAKVYFQPSRREALGSALCEAMLCECYPVGTNVGGIPTVIGKTGSIIPYGNVEVTKAAIQKGFSDLRNKDARDRIITHFSLEQRERKILEIIKSLSYA